MALYDYARSNKPLPRPIETRKCTVSELILEEWTEGEGHAHEWPEAELSAEERQDQIKLEGYTPVPPVTSSEPDSMPTESTEGKRPPAFTLRMTVSSGTYVRSIIHDIGLALGSAAHVVVLQRSKQGEFGLADCVEWSVLKEGIEALQEQKSSRGDVKAPWENEVLAKFQSLSSASTDK